MLSPAKGEAGNGSIELSIGKSLFRSLSATHVIASGNARRSSSSNVPTLTGSYLNYGATLSGSKPFCLHVPGAMPPAIVCIPSGDKEEFLKQLLWKIKLNFK